jgi:hypothetical protein
MDPHRGLKCTPYANVGSAQKSAELSRKIKEYLINLNSL